MPGGSVDVRIRTKDKTKVLSWPTRLKIAVGTARDLQFLHTALHGNKPLIHGNIKSANILLDLMDQPRIGDFGLACEGPEKYYTHVQVTRVHGTLPYLPEEFIPKVETIQHQNRYLQFRCCVVRTGHCSSPAGDNKRLLKDHVMNYPDGDVLQLKDAKSQGDDSIFKGLGRLACKGRPKTGTYFHNSPKRAFVFDHR